MKGYPLGTGQTLLAIWGVLLMLFVLWVIVVPFVVQTVRKVRADRAWLRARAARKARGTVWGEAPEPDPDSGPMIYVYQPEEYARQAEANRLADPAWFVPAERPSEEP
jgi:hypothetical protein